MGTPPWGVPVSMFYKRNPAFLLTWGSWIWDIAPCRWSELLGILSPGAQRVFLGWGLMESPPGGPIPASAETCRGPLTVLFLFWSCPPCYFPALLLSQSQHFPPLPVPTSCWEGLICIQAFMCLVNGDRCGLFWATRAHPLR